MNLAACILIAFIICPALHSALVGSSSYPKKSGGKPQTQDDLDPDTKSQFQKFKKVNSKNYGSDENSHRAIKFRNNLLKIKERNKKHKGYTQGVTPFIDLDETQFIATFLIKIGNIPSSKRLPTVIAVSPVTSIDWTSRAGPIRNQGYCGSCWAFSAVGVIQINERIQKNAWMIKDYSEQQVLDCCRSPYGPYISQGCSGGYPHQALSYLVGGSVVQLSYRYKASVNPCPSFKYINKIISGYTQTSGQYNALIALASGTASVFVDASTWQFYVNGILNCQSVGLNHAVVLVGVESGSYWKARNSWGTGWGESGYIKLNYASPCGLTQYIYVPNIL